MERRLRKQSKLNQDRNTQLFTKCIPQPTYLREKAKVIGKVDEKARFYKLLRYLKEKKKDNDQSFKSNTYSYDIEDNCGVISDMGATIKTNLIISESKDYKIKNSVNPANYKSVNPMSRNQSRIHTAHINKRIAVANTKGNDRDKTTFELLSSSKFHVNQNSSISPQAKRIMNKTIGFGEGFKHSNKSVHDLNDSNNFNKSRNMDYGGTKIMQTLSQPGMRESRRNKF